MKTIEIEVEITMFKDAFKKIPIGSGYRPGFSFVEESLVSGQIHLTDKELLYPGETGLAKVRFVVLNLFGNQLKVGNTIRIFEAFQEVGECKITKV